MIMRKVVKLALLLGAVLMVGCSQSPQKQAEEAVLKHLKGLNLNYTPKQFGQLNSLKLREDSDYIVAKDSLRYYKKELTKMSNQFRMASMQQGAKRMKYNIQELELLYKKRKYSISHTYSIVKADSTLNVSEDFYLSSSFKIVK